MPDLRTTVTELTTGLGMLGFGSLDEALSAKPAEMVSVSPETWELLEQARAGGSLSSEFQVAFENGSAFLAAVDGLRHRRPVIVEWKGSHRAPGDEVAPVDLRVDHVFLVSCKYLSKITINASPFHLFDRLLQGGHGLRDADWYHRVAPATHDQLYRSVCGVLGLTHLPATTGDLTVAQRRELSGLLAGGWPSEVADVREVFVEEVAVRTARLWEAKLGTTSAREALLWRMLRMGSAPYFVLGASKRAALRLRIATPWDWRLKFRLRNLSIRARPGGQPVVAWTAAVEDRFAGGLSQIEGHVEIRWSHGRFSGNPEAKVYLDTPHDLVPGYFPLT